MKKIFPLLLAGAIACNTESDVDPATGNFIRYFGSENNRIAVLALEANNGYSLLNNIEIQIDVTHVDYKISFIRTDLDGNYQWEKSYPAFGEAGSFSASSFLPLENSGYLLVGEEIKSNGQSDLLLLRIDPDGNMLDSATISLPNNVSLKGRAVIQDAGGDFVALARIEGDATYDMYVGKFSASDLSLLWERKYGAGTSTLINRLYTNSANNLLWAGSVVTSGAMNDLRIIRAPENSQTVIIGNPIGEPAVDEFAVDFCPGIGGWTFAGKTNKNGDDDIYVMKISSSSINSDILFATTIQIQGSNEEANGITELSDGGYAVLGTVETATTQRDLYITKLDGFGNQLWSYNYGGGDNEEGASVRQTSDNSILIFGNTFFGEVQKLILMKVTQDGVL